MTFTRPLALGLAIALALTALDSADARERRGSRPAEGQQQQAAAEARYPNSTRQEPEQQGARSVEKERIALVEAYQAQKWDEALTLAEALYGKSDGNAFDRSLAAQVAAMSLSQKDSNNHAAISPWVQKALDANGLDNNNHFGFMYELAQRHLIMQDYAKALATVDAFLSQSGDSQSAQALAVKGNALYRLQRLPEAEVALKAAIAAKPDQASDWTYLLIQVYTEQGKTDEAAALAATLGTSNASDRAAQLNLAASYYNRNQLDKAAEVVGRLREAGQLQEESDYMTAIAVYSKMDDREEDIIAVITQGLEKGALKENAQVLNALAEAYYYTDQIDPAIDAWKRAAPLARDGTSFLNLAIVLNGEQRFAEAKAAAMSALDKGLGKPADAWRQIAEAEAGLGNSAAAAAARSRAGR